jgi:hypothetical protein
MAEDGGHDPQGLPTPTRFPDGDHHLVISSPSEESGRLERHGASRASVSNGARHPGRFTLHERRAGTGAPRGTYRPARSCLFPTLLRAPPEIRTRNLFLLGEAPLPSWARRALRVTDRIRTGAETLARSRANR